MTNTFKLKALIVYNGYTQKAIANKLGLSMQSLNKKIHNKSEFKASEITKLCNILSIENCAPIFFSVDVEYKSTNLQC